MESSKYVPIACQMYDTLESLAVLKKDVTIKYEDENKNIQVIVEKIVDFQTKDKEEFIILSNQTKIRLDKIIEYTY